jgi:hypothetical protein
LNDKTIEDDDTMSTNQQRNTFDDLSDRAQELIDRGNRRHVILRSPGGSVLADLPLTWAVVGLVIAVIIPGSLPLLLIAAAVGMVAKVRIEIVRDVETDDNLVDMTSEHDERL